MKKIIISALSILLAIIIAINAFSSFAATKQDDITVLFTHDLHSHFLPFNTDTEKNVGGYARLMTAINEQKEKHPDAILVDGGDFSMGSLFQTSFASEALELKIMGKLGFDATTFGNHEFDYLQEGLISMLNTAKKSGDIIPNIVCSNYRVPNDNIELQKAFNNYGVNDFTVIEKGDDTFVVFGIFGEDADDCAPNSGMELIDAQNTAQQVVNTATEYCKKTLNRDDPIFICLSHSGTEDGAGEDYELAKNVEGIDVIVSAHTHTELKKPIKVNDTYIVSCGEYGKNLGSITLTKKDDKFELKKYSLTKINDKIEEDKIITNTINEYKNSVNKNYLEKYGFSFDEVITNNPYEFESVDDVYATQHESTLCNIFADAYKWAADSVVEGDVDVALTAAGVIRESLPKGNITVSDVFNSASLGVGTEGELVSIYLTGKDLKNVVEVDASVVPLMKSAQLFCSGIEYSFNTNRMIFNKVDYAMLRNNDKSLEKIENDKLYRVVTSMYVGQMLGAVEEKSFGLIKITPRDKNGNAIDVKNLKDYVLKSKNGEPIKEWYAISSYLKNMGKKMDVKYAKPDGRKVVYSSINPVNLLSNANVFTYVLLIIILVLIAVAVLLAKIIIKKIKKKKESIS